jgi:molybdopterin-guanine dinucleotide biosynthesis protein A
VGHAREGVTREATGLLVLAGGRSERMGRDKAWLPVDGRPALLRVLAAARDAGVDAMVVVGSPGQSLPALPPDVTRVDDPAERRHEGPLSGLAVGLEHLAANGVALACLAACDALWLGPAHVRFVLARLREHPEHAAVVPASEPLDGGAPMLHPLCAAVRVAPACRAAHTLLQAGQRAARALLLELSAQRIAVAALPEPRVVEGCNTPQAWAAAVAVLRQAGHHG